MGVPSVGFFDLPAVYGEVPEISVPSPVWKADREIVAKTSKPLVGFTWAARSMETPIVAQGCYRTLTQEQAVRIADSDLSWVNLQKNESLPNLPNAGIKDWLHTARLLSALDLVVTVDTSVCHLAAAMGKPTWVLLSGAVDHKYGLCGDTTPWYPEMKLFRNDDFGFENAVRKVNDALDQPQVWWDSAICSLPSYSEIS